MLVPHEQTVALIGRHERKRIGGHRGQIVRRSNLVIESAARNVNELAAMDGGHIVIRPALVFVVDGVRETQIGIVQIDGPLPGTLPGTAVDDFLVKFVVAAF